LSANGSRTYAIHRGDTLGSIAARFYGGDRTKYGLIVAANHISDPDRLKVGTVLTIPDIGIVENGHVPSPAVRTATTPSPTTALNEDRLGQLHPVLATRGRALLELCAHHGIGVLVTQGLRTWEEQDALYAKGRTVAPIGKKYVVTQAKGGESFHNFGLAFDIVILNAIGKADWDTSHPGWKAAAELGKSVGLEWGGDWKSFRDLPHYQYTAGVRLPECRTLYADGLAALWERVSALKAPVA
jgi:hypothetical protein